MSHSTDWTCRSCRAVLDRVRDRVLRPIVPIDSVDAKGTARVSCPGCGRMRAWVLIEDGARLNGIRGTRFPRD